MTSYELLYNTLKTNVGITALVASANILTAYPESFLSLPVITLDEYQNEALGSFRSMEHMNHFKVEIFSSSKMLNITIAKAISEGLFSEFIEGTALDLDDGKIRHKVMYFNRLN